MVLPCKLDDLGIPFLGRVQRSSHNSWWIDASLNKDSYTISLWIMPQTTFTGPYTEGRLNAHGFLRGIDNMYYTNIETMIGLTPSGSNYLTNGPGDRGLDFITIVITEMLALVSIVVILT